MYSMYNVYRVPDPPAGSVPPPAEVQQVAAHVDAVVTPPDLGRHQPVRLTWEIVMFLLEITRQKGHLLH